MFDMLSENGGTRGKKLTWYNLEKELIGLKFWYGKSIKNFCDVGALVLAGLGVE